MQTGTAIGLASTETVSTQTKARAYITAIDQALSNVSVEREQVGAVMNRLRSHDGQSFKHDNEPRFGEGKSRGCGLRSGRCEPGTDAGPTAGINGNAG